MLEKTMVILQGDLIDKLNSEPSKQVEEKLSTTDNVVQLIGLVFLLIMILIAAYYTSKFVGKFKLGQLRNSNFTVIDAYRISPNKMLQIVKIGNKFVVIAIAKDTINFITELEESEVLIREEQETVTPNFKQIFDKIGNKMNKE